MKTADWYTPWLYRVGSTLPRLQVEISNGAGQTVLIKESFVTVEEAEAWIDEHKLERAESWGALLS
jgi:hypothetical protein